MIRVMSESTDSRIELLHLVARAADRAQPLRTRAACADLWSRSAHSAAIEFDIRERRLYLLSAAKWTGYRAPQLARSIGLHPASVRRFLRCVEVEAAADAEGGSQADTAGTRASIRHRMNNDEVRAIPMTLADERLRWNVLSSAFR